MSYLTAPELTGIAAPPAAGDSTEALLAKLAGIQAPTITSIVFGGTASVTYAENTIRSIQVQGQSGAAQAQIAIDAATVALAAGKDWSLHSPNGLPFPVPIVITALAGTLVITTL